MGEGNAELKVASIKALRRSVAFLVNIKALRMSVTLLMGSLQKDNPRHNAIRPSLEELAFWADSNQDASQSEIDAAVEICNAQLRLITDGQGD